MRARPRGGMKGLMSCFVKPNVYRMQADPNPLCAWVWWVHYLTAHWYPVIHVGQILVRVDAVTLLRGEQCCCRVLLSQFL